jgi:uncharacterized protein YPO0396
VKEMKEERERLEVAQEETTELNQHKIEKEDTNQKENNRKMKEWIEKVVGIADQKRTDTAMTLIDRSLK